MKKITIVFLFAFTLGFSQNEMKTIKRPDGVIIKYFNPVPVVIANSHEAGLSLYKNINTKQYYLVLTILFKQQKPTELTGELLIQTTGTKGLILPPVWHKLINMNGQNVASSMYLLTNRDINELKIRLIKLINFTAYNQPIGLNLTKNNDILMKEFSILK